MNLKKLKGKMVEKGWNVDRLALHLGIDRSSMYRKLNNFDRITIGEAKRITELLELSKEDATTIFLGE